MTRNTLRSSRMIHLLLALFLLAAACGDGDDSAADEGEQTTTSTTAAATTTTAAATTTAPTTQPEPEAPYYEGKRITWIVTWEPGGNGDNYARQAARFLPKHIPGEPSIIVENMTGGGHNIGTNFMFNQAEANGLTIGTFPSHRMIASAIGEEGANFDATEFNWLATLWGGSSVCVAWHESPFTSVADLANSEQEWIVGSLSPSAAGATAVSILAPDLDWNTKLILGYDGNTEVALAMQQGEVDGMCLPWANLLSFGPEWEQDVTPLFAIGLHRDPFLPDVPATAEQDVFDLSPVVREAIDAYVSRFEINVSVTAPPGTDPEVVQILRDAFDAMMADPEYQAAMEEGGLPTVGQKPGTEVQDIVQGMHDASPDAWDYVLKAQSGE